MKGVSPFAAGLLHTPTYLPAGHTAHGGQMWSGESSEAPVHALAWYVPTLQGGHALHAVWLMLDAEHTPVMYSPTLHLLHSSHTGMSPLYLPVHPPTLAW